MKRKALLVLFIIFIMLIVIVGCAPPVPTVQYGTINVNSTPVGAKVYLDSVDTGYVTPIILPNIEVGSYTIKIDKFHYKIWEYTINVNADETTYINPILIYAPDETIILQPGAVAGQTGTEGKDAMVYSCFPDDNFVNHQTIAAGIAFGEDIIETGIGRTYIQFDLSTVPAGAMVTDADLKLYQIGAVGSGKFVTISLYQVIRGWKENTITWNNQPDSSGIVETSCNITIGSVGWESWDIDNLVQGWFSGNITNYGMLLKCAENILINEVANFHSSEYTPDPGKHPKLEIDYYIP
jgi:uncharacterized membrane protein